MKLPHHCNGCTARWDGYNTCHCAACHRTFTTIKNFDLHRRGQCLPPAAVGLVRSDRTYECFGRPLSLPVGGSGRGTEVPKGKDTGDVFRGAQIGDPA